MKKNIKEAKIMIVDDNSVNRQVLLFTIAKYGIKPLIAENGQVALEKYIQNPCDLVLMDIMMPVMDGLDATKSIRNHENENNLKRSNIIAISANFQEEDYDHYLSMGLDKITKKPLNFKELDTWLKEQFEF